MNINEKDIDFYVDKIAKGEHFSFSRWGDGEFTCLTGGGVHNCDKHMYYDGLRSDLRQVLLNRKEYYKTTWKVNHGHGKRIWRINRRGLKPKSLVQFEWYDATVWERLAMSEDIANFIDILNSKNFIMVSSEAKKKLNFTKDYIVVPDKNCYLEKDRIEKEILEMSTKYENPIFGFSASMTTNVMIDDLYDQIGDRCTMIDFGSIWEPFIGNRCRSYHKLYKIKDMSSFVIGG